MSILPHGDPRSWRDLIYRSLVMIFLLLGLWLQAYTRHDTEETERIVSIVPTVLPTVLPGWTSR